MRDVIARLEGTEQRIERLLASGWRARGAEADALAAEADALDTIGLTALAARLRAVAGAADAPAALGAVALALAASRRLRARLGSDRPADGEWTSGLPAPRKQAERTPDALIPLARLELRQQLYWACARVRSGNPRELLLIEPPG